MIRRILFTAVLAAFAGLLAGCPPPADSGSTGGGPTSGSGDTIRVGYYGDLTGATASFGTSTLEGIELALDEINSDPPLGKKIELFTEDDQGKSEQAATVVTKLITQDRVVAVLGEVASSNSLAAAPKCQEAQVPMISPSSTNPDVTRVGDYIFRICFIDPFQGEVMAKFARNNLKAQSAAVLTDTKSDYSKGLARFFTETFRELGGQIAADLSYSQGDSDFNAQLNSIKQSNPDVVFVPGYYTEVGSIARQARDAGIRVPLIGGDGWDSPKLFESAGNALEGAYFSNHYSNENEDPKVQNFIERYASKFNKQPDAMAALGYDTALILADSIRRAGSTDGPALRDAIAATSNFEGATGNITLNAERNADKPAVVLQIRGKEYKYVETVQP